MPYKNKRDRADAVRRWRERHGNPSGVIPVTPADGERPSSVIPDISKALSIPGRKELLAAIAVIGNPRFANPIAAMTELNKMEGAYPPERHLIANVDVVFVIGKGYQDTAQITEQEVE